MIQILIITLLLLRAECKQSEFSNLTNYPESSKEQIAFSNEDATALHSGKASLAFVFDTTGSMHFVLDCVKSGASRILQTVLEVKKNIIHNFIFSPFNDPEIGPLTVTTDPVVYKQALNNVTVGGGGDCPELQLHGILAALKASLPNSYIYVFTNSNAKDVQLIDEILSIIQKKSCQVVFVLTGYCLDYGFQRDVYTEIAAASFGQVFYLHQYNVNEMLEMIRLSLKENIVGLISIDSPRQTYDTVTYTIAIDDTVNGITISLSGKSATIIITDSHGYVIQCSFVTRCLINLPNIKIVDIPDPAPGNWLLNVTSESQYSLRASGTSEIHFRHGFSITPTIHFNETSHRPLKDCINYILIRLVNCQVIEKVKSLDIVGLNGAVEQTLYVNKTSVNDSIYVTAFTPSNIFFHIRITGYTKDGYLVRRITKTATSPLTHDEKCEDVRPKEWVSPAVSIQPSNIYFKKGDNVSILCSIIAGHPFPSIIWKKDNETLQKATINSERYVTYRNSNRTYLSIINANISDEGIYACEASNMFVTSKAQAELHYYEVPKIKAVHNRLFAEINRTVTLECNTVGIPRPIIRWFHGSDLLSCITSSEKYEIFSEGKLKIRQYNKSDEGEYWCMGTNIIGENFDIIDLSTGFPPTIMDERIYIPILMVQNSSVLLKCEIRSNCLPKPSIKWNFQNYHCVGGFCNITLDIPSSTNKSTILVKDPGIYYCIANNEFGNVTQVFNVTVQYTAGRPKITSSRDTNITLHEGDDYAIDCIANGNPSSVNWFFNSKLISSISKYQDENMMVLQNDTLLLIDVEKNNTGFYKCQVQNDIGTDTITYDIRIISENYFDYSEGEVIKVELFQNAVLNCPNANNHTEWFKNKLQLDLTNNERADEYHYRLSNRNRTLKIINVHEPDDGIYTCVSTIGNKSNEQQRNFRLYTLRAPIFEDDTHWNHRNVDKRTAITFSCVADGFTPPMVKWLKIDKKKWPVNQWTMRNISMSNRKQSMTITYVTDEHDGIYRCTVRNIVSATTKYFVLKVRN